MCVCRRTLDPLGQVDFQASISVSLDAYFDLKFIIKRGCESWIVFKMALGWSQNYLTAIKCNSSCNFYETNILLFYKITRTMWCIIPHSKGSEITKTWTNFFSTIHNFAVYIFVNRRESMCVRQILIIKIIIFESANDLFSNKIPFLTQMVLSFVARIYL